MDAVIAVALTIIGLVLLVKFIYTELTWQGGYRRSRAWEVGDMFRIQNPYSLEWEYATLIGKYPHAVRFEIKYHDYPDDSYIDTRSYYELDEDSVVLVQSVE